MEEITEEERTEIYKSDVYRLHVLSVVFACICVVAIMVWAGIFLLNTRYQSWTSPNKGLVYDTRYQLTWILLFPLAFNILLPYALLAALAKRTSLVRFDLHYVLSWILFFINVLIVIALVILYFLYYDSLWSVGDAMDNPQSCCLYYLDSDRCINYPGTPCAAFSGTLSTTWIFYGHLAFAILFTVFSAFHMGLNRLMHTNGLISLSGNKIQEGMMSGFLFVFIFMLLFGYWAAVPLFNTVYIHGYPIFGIPPSPGEFQSTRYTLPYWTLFVIGLNLLCPYAFIAAIALRKTSFSPWLYLWITIILSFVTLGVIVYFAFYWVAFCNYPFSKGSLCNDYIWCGKYFDKAPEYCANVTPYEPVGGLFANPEFIQHFIFAILFFILDIVGIWLQERMKKYGVFFV